MRLLLLTLLSVAPSVHSIDYQSPRTVGVGGAGHAAPVFNDSIYMNPAYVSFLSNYSVAGAYATTDRTQTDGSSRLYNFSLIDGTTQMLFQAGAGYTQRADGRLLNLGASKAFYERLGVGMGAKFFFPSERGFGSVQDMLLSVTYIATPWLRVALLADNLISRPKSRRQGFHRQIVLGTEVSFGTLLKVLADPVYDFRATGTDALGVKGGAELTLFDDFRLRAGAFYNTAPPHFQSRGNGFGFGGGWVAPKLSLDYAFSRMFEDLEGGSPASSHVFGATVFF